MTFFGIYPSEELFEGAVRKSEVEANKITRNYFESQTKYTPPLFTSLQNGAGMWLLYSKARLYILPLNREQLRKLLYWREICYIRRNKEKPQRL